MYIIHAVFLLLWVVFFIKLGLWGIIYSLGGISVLFFLSPLVVPVFLKENGLKVLRSSIYLTIVGVMAINIVFYNIFFIAEHIPSMITIYIITIFCIGIVGNGLILFLWSFMKSREEIPEIREYSPIAAVINYFGVITMILLLISVFVVTFAILPGKLTPELYGLITKLGVGIFVLSFIIIAIRFIPVPKEAISLISKERKRYSCNYAKVKNLGIAALILFIALSAYVEYLYRGDWVTWIESQIIIVSYLMILFKFARTFFETVPVTNKEAAIKSLPRSRIRYLNRAFPE